MQIAITGPRGCGKTTVGRDIAAYLRFRGCRVRLFGNSEHQTRRLNQSVDITPPLTPLLPTRVNILDSFDDQDEYHVQELARSISSAVQIEQPDVAPALCAKKCLADALHLLQRLNELTNPLISADSRELHRVRLAVQSFLGKVKALDDSQVAESE